MKRSREHALAVACVAATAFTAALALFLPIYSDELVWKVVQSRAILDGGRAIRQIQVSCGEPYTRPVPFFLYPFRWLDGLLYGDLTHPLKLRFGGVLTHLGWLSLAGAIVVRVHAKAIGTWRTLGLWSALFGLGTLPFILVLNRPEQWMLWGAALLAGAPIAARRAGAAPGAGAWCTAAGLCLVATGLFGQHAKGLFLLPLALAAVASTVGPRAPRYVALLVVLASAAAAARDWRARIACPGDPFVESRMRSDMALDRLSSGDVLGPVRDALAGELDPQRAYAAQLLFGHDAWHWIQPETPVGPVARSVNAAVRVAGLAILPALALTCLAVARRWLAARTLEPRDAGALGLAAAVAGLFVLQQRRLHYESGFLFALALLALALAFRPPTRPRSRAAARWLATGLLALSVASQLVLAARFGPRVGVNARSLGYAEGQELSFSAFRYDELRPRVLAAARACGIDPAGRLDRLVVDDITYPALSTAVREPLHVGYATGFWARSMPNLSRYLREHRSAGLVVDCRFASRAASPRLRRFEGLCCLPAFAPAARTDSIRGSEVFRGSSAER